MKQNWEGLDWFPDILRISEELKSPPVIPDSSHKGQTFIDQDVFDNRDVFDTTEIFLKISSVSRGVIPRVAIPIIGSYSSGTQTNLMPLEQLRVYKATNDMDNTYYMQNNNVLSNLNILNDQKVVDEIPTLISNATLPFWG